MKRKNILICGATHGSNFGDILFAYLFHEFIKNESEADIYFTKASDYSQRFLGIKPMKLKHLFSADALVYISGGYFGQSHHENIKTSLQRFLHYFAVGILTAIRRKPISIIGVGAGPLDRSFLRRAAVYIFKKARFVSVRDVESKEYMNKYGVHREIAVTSDSAQVVGDNLLNDNIAPFNESEMAKLNGKHTVLVHVPSVEKKEFNEIIVPAINESLFQDENISYILSHDAAIKSDYIHDIYKAFPQDRTVIYHFNDPIQFLKVIDMADTVITTKLHVGILAATFSKAIVSFPLHPEKTKRYYNQIGYPDISKSLFEVSKDEAVQMIKTYLHQKVELTPNIRTLSNQNFELLHQFIKSL